MQAGNQQVAAKLWWIFSSIYMESELPLLYIILLLVNSRYSFCITSYIELILTFFLTFYQASFNVVFFVILCQYLQWLPLTVYVAPVSSQLPGRSSGRVYEV